MEERLEELGFQKEFQFFAKNEQEMKMQKKSNKTGS